MGLERLISVARGDEPGDLLFTNGRVVNTFTGEVEETAVAVAEGKIAGLGDYRSGRQVVDLAGRFLVPGLVDGHVHLESSLLHVNEYARAVLPHGTTAVVTDLHEIANVAGLPGIRYIMECARRVPMDIYFTAPSCVPSSDLETAGARIGAEDVRRILRWKNVVGLGEMMEFSRVIRGEAAVLEKLRAVRSGPRDGHAPGVTGKELNAYLAPLIGSDHESTQLVEGLEKLRRGQYLMIREGSAERNLEALLPLVTDQTFHRCILVVDDRDPLDIYQDGDMDAIIRKAIGLGLDPIRAIRMATLNPATYFRLEGIGGIAPGYWANLLVVSDLSRFQVDEVYHRGRLAAREGKATFQVHLPRPNSITHSVNIKPVSQEDLALRVDHSDEIPAIQVVPGQIITRRAMVSPARRNGAVVPDPARDLLKLAVIERHRGTGNVGVGLITGLGLKSGAIGSSMAHDSHNIIVAGASDEDILAVVREIEANQGGLACAEGGRILASLPLPVAGLLSQEPLETVVGQMRALEEAARGLGCQVPSPFSVLSFMALAVIPELKLTDLGLVDVAEERIITP